MLPSKIRQTLRLPLLYCIILPLLLNNLSSEAQLIINPGQFSIISCGINDPCHIICNETEICAGSIFNVHDTVTIECSAQESCKNTTITTTNINSLYALFSGKNSFVESQFLSTPNDKNVTIHCDALYACELTQFYHYSSTMATHICSDEASCSHTSINYASNGASSLICNGMRSCSSVCRSGHPFEACSARCPSNVVDGSNVCPDTEINIYSNNIYVECSGTKSCAEIPINVYNFTSLNMVLDGQSTFYKAILTTSSNKTNSDINIHCLYSEACDQAEFYYSGSSSVYHLCAYEIACSYFKVVAETRAPKILNCTESSSCPHSVIQLRFSTSKLICVGYLSCEAASIWTRYVQSLDIMAFGQRSWEWGKLYTRNSDNNITVLCNGISSCYHTGSYYNASGTVIHKCNAPTSCEAAVINSFVGASIICNGSLPGSGPCIWSILVMPFDIDEFNRSKLILVGNAAVKTGLFYPFHIYSLFGMQTEQIICIDCEFTDIVVIYGLKFNKICWLSDGCLDNIMLDIDYQPQDIQIASTYAYDLDESTSILNASGLDYQSYDTDKLHFVIVLAYLPGYFHLWDYILYPPEMNSDDSWVSVICLDSSCTGMDIDMSSTMNSALTFIRDSKPTVAGFVSSALCVVQCTLLF